MVYGETGTLPLESIINKRMVSFWTKLVQGRQSKLSVTLYRVLREKYTRYLAGNETYEPKWIAKIKQILDEIGFSNVWSEQEVVNTEWFKKSAELRISDIALQNWRSEIERNRLCTNYRIFKDDLCFEKYLLELGPADRINLCRFRCGNSRLPSKESRYVANIEHVSCTLCNSNEPGDEFHYTLVCPAFNQARKLYIKPYYFTRPNTVKMKELFNVESHKQLTSLAKFVSLITSTF